MLRLPTFPHLREDSVRQGFLEDGQYTKLVEHSPELWFRAMLELGRTYGWRTSELKMMSVKQVDLFSRTIRLEPGTTKNGEGREVTMTAPVFALLKECLSGRTSTSTSEQARRKRQERSKILVLLTIRSKRARSSAVRAVDS